MCVSRTGVVSPFCLNLRESLPVVKATISESCVSMGSRRENDGWNESLVETNANITEAK